MKIVSFLACVVCGVGLSGCLPTKSVLTGEAALVGQVIAEHCEVGVWYNTGNRGQRENIVVRLGKVDKRSDLIIFHHKNKIDFTRIFVHSIQDLHGGWAVADVAYEGQRDNLYFNRQSGAFACSTDEWRAVNADREATFEISPLITSRTLKTMPQ